MIHNHEEMLIMATATRRRPTTRTADKVDAYQEITDQVIEMMEQTNLAPWHQPWTTADGSSNMPRSLSTGKVYRGSNVFTLGLTAMIKGYGSPWWGTYKQISARGGQVRKGEKSTVVIFWKKILVDDKENAGKKRMVFMLRTYRVFNADQADNLTTPKLPEPPPPAERIESAEAALAGYYGAPKAPLLSYGAEAAFYQPTRDHVFMPDRETFESPESFYSTLFHETAHSTGHESRLNRKSDLGEIHKFGDVSYSREELVAEMTAAFLSGLTGIAAVNLPQNAAYIKHWIGVLKGDHKLLVTAAAQAQKAADLILGTTFEESSDDE